jgi:hypothetical protein
MALLDWFRQSTPKIDEAHFPASLVEDTIDYVVKMTDARLTLVNNYRPRLSGPVTRTLQYLSTLRAGLPATRQVNAQSWSHDPCMRAFFGQSSDLVRVFAGNEPLHQFASSALSTEPIHAILAMQLTEQTRFGTDMQGSMLIRDVAQKALSFSNHQLPLFAHSDKDLFRSITRRMLDELALLALELMHAEQAERRELEEHRQLLSARLSTFHRRGAGLDVFIDKPDSAVSPAESAELLRQLEQNETRLASLGSPAETLDRQLDYLAQVLAEPMRFIRFALRREHVDSMNIISESGEEIEFGIVTVERPSPQQRVFMPLIIDHALVGDGRRLQLDNAERWL